MTDRAKNTQVNFRTNDTLLAKAREIVSFEDMDMSTLFNNLLEHIVAEDSVPYVLLNHEKTKKERIVEELFVEIKKGYDSLQDGKGLTMEEVFSEYGL